MSLQRTADAAAAISVPAWLASWAVNALPIVQVVAGLVAIIAGLFAIAVHVQKLRRG